MFALRRLWFAVALSCPLAAAQAWAEGPGQEDLDEALREKITAEDLRDVNRVIDLLQSAVDKGLDDESLTFADQMLAETLMQRATQLMAAIDRVAPAEQADPRIQQVRGMAVSDLRRILAATNPPGSARLMLGKLQAGPGGDPHEAKRILTDYVKDETASADDRAIAYALRAQLQSDPARRLADMDQAIELEPENPRFRLARAALLRQDKNLDQALADVATVLADNPDELAAYLLQSEILREQQKYDDALAVLEKATIAVPDSPVPYQQRGEIFRQQGETAKAIEEFGKVLTMAPDSLLTLIHRAEANLSEENFAAAMADVDATLAKQPGLIAALRLRCQILAAEDKLAEAIAEMEKLVAAAPNQPELQMQLALYSVIAKQPRRAIAAYDAVLADDPDNYLARRSRGDAYLNVGEHAPAVDDFNKALEIEPHDPALLNNLAWVLATSPDDEVRDGKRAVELAEQACKLTDYKAAHILSTLAAAYAEAGDFAKAKEWSKKAVELGDEDYDGQLAKELASYEAGKPWRERQDLEAEAAAESAAEKPSAEAPSDGAESPEAQPDDPATTDDQATPPAGVAAGSEAK
ncbi:MAG: tetratricopeptide repeat protein [Pirellulales bacterium]|nr:tetratricopeptide repeat protein [Pirellulales bacterium]